MAWGDWFRPTNYYHKPLKSETVFTKTFYITYPPGVHALFFLWELQLEGRWLKASKFYLHILYLRPPPPDVPSEKKMCRRLCPTSLRPPDLRSDPEPTTLPTLSNCFIFRPGMTITAASTDQGEWPRVHLASPHRSWPGAAYAAHETRGDAVH